MHIVILVETP